MISPKKIIGIDLDDVLLDFNTALCQFHNLKYKTSYTRDDIFSFNLREVWNCSKEEEVSRVVDFYATDAHGDAAPVPGSVEAIKKLKERFSLVIITSKPDSLEKVTKAWLDKHFPDSFDAVYFTNQFLGTGVKRKKSDICTELGVTLFVDDSISNALDIATDSRKVLLLDAPWNQTHDLPSNVVRIYSWDEIVGYVG